MKEIFKNGYALLVGVGGDLPNTVDDATCMRDILVDPDRCAYLPENVMLLTGPQATKKKILEALSILGKKTDDESSFLFYFSGHGADGNDQYFFIPNDFDKTQGCSTAISDIEFINCLDEFEAKRIVLILDCCHAEGLGRIQGRRFTTIASSRKKENSLLGQPFSIFTLALFDGFCGSGSQDCDHIRIADLAMHTRSLVNELTDRQQNPILDYQEEDNFIIARNHGGQSKKDDFAKVIQSIINLIRYQNEYKKDSDKLNLIQEQGETLIREIKIKRRQGRKIDAKNLIDPFKKPERWDYLNPTIKAEILILEAELYLDINNDISVAKKMLDKALSYDYKVDQTRARSYIAYLENGISEALGEISHRTDLVGFNFLAALYLDSGKFDEALDVLSDQNLQGYGLASNHETWRIRSLAFVCKNELLKARKCINKSLELDPDYQLSKITEAKINYLESLSPVVSRPEKFIIPEPFPKDLARTEDELLENLEDSIKFFDDLRRSDQINDRERLEYSVWYFACVINHPDFEMELKRIAQQLIDIYPLDHLIISWIISRNICVDLSNSKKGIIQELEKEPGNHHRIIMLIAIHLRDGDLISAKNTLEKSKDDFHENNLAPEWYFWYLKYLLLSDELSSAQKILEDDSLQEVLTPEMRYLVLSALAIKSGRTDDVESFLDEYYEVNGNPIYLYYLCEIRYENKSWDLIFEHIDELVNSVQTKRAVWIAIISAKETGHPRKALELLVEGRKYFRNRDLPEPLKKLEIECLLLDNKISTAVSSAESLYNNSPSQDNIRYLVNIYYRIGNSSKIVSLAHEVMRKDGINVEIYLLLIQIVKEHDLKLACRLWNKVTDDINRIPDELVSDFYILCFALGLDSKAKIFSKRLSNLIAMENSGIRAFELDQIKRMMKQTSDSRSIIQDQYEKGLIPIHLFNNYLSSGSISKIFFDIARFNREAADGFAKRFPIFFRYDRRRLILSNTENVFERELLLDISSIFTAFYFEYFDHIVSKFKKVYISSHTLPVLQNMRHRIMHHQPSRVDAINAILDYINRSKIHVINLQTFPEPLSYSQEIVEDLGRDWLKIVNIVIGQKGFLVDFLPKTKKGENGKPIDVPREINDVLINVRTVVQALLEHGFLSKADYDRCLDMMPAEKKANKGLTLPEQGCVLVFHNNIIETIAGMKILYEVSKCFRVSIVESFYQDIKATVDYSTRTQEEVDFIDRIQNELNHKIGLGSIRFSSKETNHQSDGDFSVDPELICLYTLMEAAKSENTLLCVDDRFLNKFPLCNKAPIISFFEILQLLHQGGEISQVEYYSILCKMRESNIQYIPLSSDELIYLLRNAFDSENSFHETMELRTIRRYIATCLLQDNFVQDVKPHSINELKNEKLEFCLHIDREVVEAVIKLWEGESDSSIIYQQIDWLVRNLLVGLFGVFKSESQNIGTNQNEYYQALSIARFFSAALELKLESKREGSNKCKSYLDWAYHKIIIPRTQYNDRLLNLIVEILKSSVFGNWESIELGLSEAEKRGLQLEYFVDFPEPLREEFLKDEEFSTKYGFSETISFGKNVFIMDEFINSIFQAFRSSNVGVCSINGQRFQVDISRDSRKPEIALRIKDKEPFVITDEIFFVLSNVDEEVKATLQRNIEWFDCNSRLKEKVIDEIYDLEKPIDKFRLVEHYLEMNLNYYYQSLKRKFFVNTVKITDFRPNGVTSFLNAFRINEVPKIDVQHHFEVGVEELISDLGIVEVLKRYSHLPISLPTSIIREFTKLPLEQQKEVLEELRKELVSPLHLIHQIRLVVELVKIHTECEDILCDLLNELLLFGRVEYEAFFAILKWVYLDIAQWPSAKILSPEVRLLFVWYHANNLFSTMNLLGVDLLKLTDYFRANTFNLITRYYEDFNEIEFDVLNPNHVTRGQMILSGIQESLHDIVFEPSKELRNLLLGLTFLSFDDCLWPHPALFRDCSALKNICDSFLGDSFSRIHFFTKVFSIEHCDMLDPESMSTLMLNVLDSLVNDQQNISYWLFIDSFFGDLPVGAVYEEKLMLLLLQVNYLEIVKKDFPLGLTIIHLASRQAMKMKNGRVRDKLSDDLISIIDLLLDEDVLQSCDRSRFLGVGYELVYRLVDSAFNLTGNCDNSVGEFGLLIKMMLKKYPKGRVAIQNIVLKFCEILPINIWNDLSETVLCSRLIL